MKKIHKILGILVLAIIVSSCTEELFVYNGEAVTHFTSDGAGLAAITDEDTYALEVGTTTSSAASVQLTISENSTAIEGVHFQEFSKSVSIGEGKFVAEVIITPIVNNLIPGEPKILIINMDGGKDVEGEEYAGLTKSFALKLERNCPSTIPEGTYWETNTGTGGADRAVTLTALGDGRYSISQMNFDFFNPGYADIPGEFVDVCNSLELQAVPVGAVFGIAWVGPGTYDENTGNLSFAVSDATYCPASCYISNMVFEYKP